MSIDQLRDELAGLMGWKKRASGFWYLVEDEGFTAIHPVELSLDWLAANGLPEGWFWWLVDFYETRVDVTINGSCDGDILTSTALTELHARLAACVAAWKAQAERSGT